MNHLNLRKLIIGLAVCAVILAVAVLAQRFPTLSGLSSSESSMPNQPAIQARQATTTLLAATDARASASASAVEPRTPTNTVQSNAPLAHVMITEVMTGKATNAKYEFVELYNAGPGTADLTGWTIRKKTATGSISTLVSANRLKGKTMAEGGYYLLAGGGYTEPPAADVSWAASVSLASKKNAVLLYNALGDTVDTVTWGEIPDGESLSRSAPTAATFTLGAPTPTDSLD